MVEGKAKLYLIVENGHVIANGGEGVDVKSINCNAEGADLFCPEISWNSINNIFRV